jgi:hemerythrin-like metal-binding protein
MLSRSPATTGPAGSNTFMPWLPSYAIGIRTFDEEHERLAGYVNHLHLTMVVRRDRGMSVQVFERLILETRKHFAHEEDLMADLAYPEAQEHRLEHVQLLDQLDEFFRLYRNGSMSALGLPVFLKAWLLTHIGEHDRRYVAFFRDHGVS